MLPMGVLSRAKGARRDIVEQKTPDAFLRPDVGEPGMQVGKAVPQAVFVDGGHRWADGGPAFGGLDGVDSVYRRQARPHNKTLGREVERVVVDLCRAELFQAAGETNGVLAPIE